MTTKAQLDRDNRFWDWLENVIEDYANTDGSEEEKNKFRRRIFNYVSRYYK